MIAQREVNSMAERVQAMETLERIGVARAEFDSARERAHHLELEHAEIMKLADGWLSAEGRLRVLASLSLPERLRLKRVLLAKRSDAYRLMCAEPVSTKLQFREARRELLVISEVGDRTPAISEEPSASQASRASSCVCC